MLASYIKAEIMQLILNKCVKCQFELNGTLQEVELLKKENTGEGLSVYVTFGNRIGLINNIKILDSNNNAILTDNREFNKNSTEVLTLLLRIDRMEVV